MFHQGLILVGVPLLIELLLIGNLSLLLIQSDKEHVRENRYRHFSAVAAKLMALTYEELSLLLVSMQSRRPSFLKNYEKYKDEIRFLQKDGMKTAENDPLLEDQQAEINDSINNLLSIMDNVADLIGSGSALQLLAEIPALEENMQSAKGVALDRIDVMRRIGQRVTQDSMKRIQKVRDLQALILWAGLLINLAAGVLLLIFYRRNIMKRVSVISSNTLLLAQGKALLSPIRGKDEIAQLDSAFHIMEQRLKSALERERALFDNASDVICVLDSNNRFLRINPACRRLWNLKQDDLLQSSLFEIIEDEQIRSAQETLAAARAVPEAQTFELKIKAKSRGIVETLWSVYWSASEESMYCVVQDITERKQIDKAKHQFLAMISSDLRRPLAKISDAVSGLVRMPEAEIPAMAAQKLQVAEKNLGRLLSLVNDLLQLAELESGRLEISKHQCSINELLTRSAQDVEALAAKNNVELEIVAEEITALVDSNRLIQVIVNLLSNAIKFSPPGATVTLSARTEGDFIECRVTDRGRGVPPTHRELIFEKFKQVEASDGKRKAGTGLGLPICKQIIEEHGGLIGVVSQEGEGSTFWFRVPLDETSSMKIKAIRLQELHEKVKEESIPKLVNSTEKLTPSKASASRITGSLTLMQKGILLIGIPIVFDLLFVGSISVLLMQTDRARQEELKQRNIAFETTQLMDNYLKTALLMHGSKTEASWVAFQQCRSEIKSSRERLKKLVKGDKIARKHFKNVDTVNERAEEFFLSVENKLGKNYEVGKHFSAMVDKTRMIPLISVMSRRLQMLIADAETQEFNPEKKAQLRELQAGLLLAGLSTSVLASIFLAIFFSKDMTARLATMADNAERFSKEQQLNEEIAGNDELASLDQAFHKTAKSLDDAHKKERAVLDNSQDLICALSADGRFTSVNPACKGMLGYNSDELLQIKIFDLLDEDNKAIASSALLEQKKGNSHTLFESYLLKKDGTPAYILWSASFDSTAENTYCIAHDITARKELESLKREFLSMVSHDLRTPLGSITGIAKLITAGAFGKPGDAAQVGLRRISAEGDKLLELINDILDIEKLEAGKMQLVQEEVEIGQLVESALESARPEVKSGVVLYLPEPVRMIADKDRLQQALTNLLNFAHSIGTTDSQQVIKVTVATKESFVEISIASPGAPLSKHEQLALFDRFGYSGDAAAPQMNELIGGLALPLAKRIIENHGGSIELHSKANENTFRLQIPRTVAKPSSSSNAVSNLVPDS